MTDYIKTMRALIGKETLLTVGCGAILEDEHGRILLQKRSDEERWGIPGGHMEIGETVEGVVKREVLEETNLTVNNLSLFGIYSGDNGFAEYGNGDKVFTVQIIFHSTDFKGTIKMNDEVKELRFFHKHEVPENLNSHQAPFINDWVNNEAVPVVK